MMERFWHTLLHWRNQIDFGLRKLIRWQRNGLTFDNQSKENMFHYLGDQEKETAEKTADTLIKRYHLQSFYENSTRINFRENLFYLSMLETAFDRAGITFESPLKAADIGPAHWFYVQALYAGLTWYGNPDRPRPVELTGYEIDAYRVFSNFYSCFDYAQAHKRSLPVKYLTQPFVTQTEKYDLILMFFPFIFRKDHLAWGLPTQHFDVLALRKAVQESLKNDGVVLIVNQGIDEHLAEKKILSEIGLTLLTDFEQDELFYRYALKRYVLVAKK